jgi:hypothetical protein
MDKGPLLSGGPLSAAAPLKAAADANYYKTE